MAVSTVLQSPADIGRAPGETSFAGGLFSRVKKIGQNLRNISREDALTVGLSMGAGFAAKAGVVAVFGASTGGLGLAALGVALAGGAAVGLAKATVKHLREGKTAKEFFNRQTLMSTASSAAIAGATLGYSEIFEFTTGDSFTNFLGKAFHKVADVVSDRVVDLVSGTHAHAEVGSRTWVGKVDYTNNLVAANTAPTPTPVAPPAPTPAPVATHTASVAPTETPAQQQPAHQKTTHTTHRASVPKVAAVDALLVAAQEKANNEFALTRLRELILNTTGVPAADGATAQELAKQFYPSNSETFLKALQQQAPQVTAPTVTPVAAKDLAPTRTIPVDTSKPVAAGLTDVKADRLSTLERAKAWAKAMNPVAATAAPQPTVPADKVVDLAQLSQLDANTDPKNIIVRATNGAEIRMPAAPNVEAELKTVKSAIHMSVLQEQVQQDYATKFGEQAPQTMTMDEMAARLSPENPKAYIDSASLAAQTALANSDSPANLNPQKLAAVCVADLPSTKEAFESRGGVLPNTCVVADGKLDMAEGDYVIVRDAAEAKPSATKGLRVLFSRVAEKTNDFIGRVVGQDTLPSMANEKMGMSPL